MRILINQPFGLGDVIFCMTIARRWLNEGHSILWPVFSQFVDGLQRAYPDIEFRDWRTVKCDYEKRAEHDCEGYRVVPLRWNVEMLNVPYHRCMETKYTLFELDYRIWKEGAMWNRDEQRESALLDSLYYRKRYSLINATYGSHSTEKAGFQFNAVGDLVLMERKSDFSLFDWAKVIENATEIHTVSTSLLYLLELLDISCPIHLYPRPNDPHFKHVDYLFTKPYILH